MKTVGIITAHCSANPGASLQAHAICKKIAEMGYQPIIIDYRPDNFIDIAERAQIGVHSSREHLKMMALGRRLNKRYHFFQQFEEEYYPKKTKCYRSPEQINSDPPLLDAYLCGSDQIWNPSHIRYDKTYFLEFAKNLSGTKLSYAVSIGQDMVDEKGCDFLKRGIDTIDYVSVREDTAKTLLQNKIRITKEVYQHIDPTLLYPASYWRAVERAPEKKLPKNYILYYPLQDNPIVEALVTKVKNQIELPCIALCSSLKKPRFADFQIEAYGPREFLYLIDKADVVLTNSFHGIALALLLGSKVIPYRNLVRNSRIESLFRTLELENTQADTTDLYQDCNWAGIGQTAKGIEERLEIERSRATKYLTEVLP